MKLHGSIAAGSKNSLNIDNATKAIDKTFKTKRLEAVFLSINCPGGSPVQTELIADYIQQKSEEKNVPVISFVEDVAASGGNYTSLTNLSKMFIFST